MALDFRIEMRPLGLGQSVAMKVYTSGRIARCTDDELRLWEALQEAKTQLEAQATPEPKPRGKKAC